MKRKIVALFMIMVMVLTVTTVAVTAKPANAAATPECHTLGVGAPAALFDQNRNYFFIFARGSDGALWYEVQNLSTDTYSAPTSLGGRLTSDPAAICVYGTAIDVSVRGGDGALWSMNTANGGASWSKWYKIGGQLLAGTGPTEFSWIYEGNPSVGRFVTGY